MTNPDKPVDDEMTCPWCREWNTHAPDCQRQIALGLQEKADE
jgi:hypothetical protein